MTEERQMMPKRKLKAKPKSKVAQPLDIQDTFSPANAKDKDFDLDISASKFQGKKGQAGTRTRTPKE